MTNQISVLVIDDNSDDRALVRRELQRGNSSLIVHEVGDAASLQEKLADGTFDLVITDYELQWENGINILKKIKQDFPDVPVIMFTGSGSEEVAVEAMKSGLDDYVLKSTKHFKKLSAAAHAALNTRFQKKELKAAEHRYQELFDTVPVGLFRCSPEGWLLDVNATFLEITGFTNRKAAGKKTMADLHHDPREFNKWREVLERHGAVASFEACIRHQDGSVKWVEIHAKALRGADGAIFYEGSIDDITQRKLDQIEKEQLIHDLQHALSHVKHLSGLLPICAACKKIRDEEGRWNVLELYIKNHSEADFTHSFCPECAHELYPEIFVDMPKS